MNKVHFDLAVIGGGPGGYTAAVRAAKLGWTVALIERRELGGTCVNRGCIPTAAMLHSGELFRKMRESAQFGLSAKDVTLDYKKLLLYRQETVRTVAEGVGQMLEMNSVHCFIGKGTVLPNRRVRVITRDNQIEFSANNILLATGSSARVLDIPGIDLTGVTDSDGALAWETLPKSLVVIGGGIIGVEYAQIFSDLGSQVVLLGTRDRLLPSIDREMSQKLKMILKKRGVDVHTGVTLRRIERHGGDLRCIYFERDTEREAVAERTMYATGRVPYIERLFEDVTLPVKDGHIVVDGCFRACLDGVYAVGDVIGGAQTAHLAMAQAAAAVENMAGRKSTVDVDTVPVCIYTDPEIASVGLTEQQAKEQGIAIRIGKAVTGRNGRSVVAREELGMAKVVVSADNGTVLGAQLMCARAGEMIGEMAAAVSNRFTSGELLRAIRPHPTYDELLAMALEGIG